MIKQTFTVIIISEGMNPEKLAWVIEASLKQMKYTDPEVTVIEHNNNGKGKIEEL